MLMKPRILLFFVLLMMSLLSAAQYTITYSANAPDIGDEFVISEVTEFENLDPGNSGANQTWDLTAYSIPNSQNGYFDHPDNTMWAGQVGSCNIALVSSDRYQTAVFYNLSSGELRLSYVGSEFSGQQNLTHYTDDFLEMVYPFAYNGSLNDEFAYVLDFSSMGFNMIDSTWGNLIAVADAWGTLVTPDNTYSNVLRVKYTIDETWKSYFDGELMNSGSWTETAYHWYCAESHNPVARMSFLDDGIEVVATLQYISMQVGLDDIVSVTPVISPNPANEYFRISELPSDVRSLSLIDCKGVKVADFSIQTSESSFPCANLKPGLYLVLCHDKNKGLISAGRLLISH